MKRLFSVCLLILCLSFPAFAGHTQAGDYGYCPGTPVEGVCPYCGGNLAAVQEDESTNQDVSDDAKPTAELGLIRLAFLIWLKS